MRGAGGAKVRTARWEDGYGWRCPACGAGLNPNDTGRHISPCWSCGAESKPTKAYLEGEELRSGALARRDNWPGYF